MLVFCHLLIQHRIIRVSKDSEKNFFALNLFEIYDIKTQQRDILREEQNISKREFSSVVDSLSDFLKTFDKASKCFSLLTTITIPLNIHIDKLVYRSDVETTTFASFPSECLNYTAINFFLQKVSTLTITKFATSTITDITLQTNVNILRANKMCSAFTPDCGYDKSNIKLTWCSDLLCVHKKDTQSFERGNYQCTHCSSTCHMRIMPFRK